MTTIDHQQAARTAVMNSVRQIEPNLYQNPHNPERYYGGLADDMLAAATPHLRAGIVKEAYERLFDIVYDKEAAEYEGPEQIHPATITFKLYEFEHVLALLEGGGQ